MAFVLELVNRALAFARRVLSLTMIFIRVELAVISRVGVSRVRCDSVMACGSFFGLFYQLGHGDDSPGN